MKATLNQEAAFNEMLFENKNKDYGAYELRTSYHEHVTHSVLITTSIVTTLIIIFVYLTNRLPEVIKTDFGNDPGILITIDPPAKPPVVIKTEQKTSAAPKTQSGEMVASDKKNDEKPPVNNDMNISKNPNPKGFEADSTAPKDPVAYVPDPPKPPATERVPDVMPALANLNKIIKDNLRFPQQAVDNHTEGTVYVSFVVEVDGSVSEIELLSKVPDGCSEEAVRVVKLLQGWKPGIKNGAAVRVPCTLPIKFRLQ